MRADSGPKIRSSGSASGSTTVTSRPGWRAEAATSLPIQPAPTTTRAAARSQRAAQRVGILERPQVVDAGELGARDSEPPRLGAGGEQQPVVAGLSPSSRTTLPAAGSSSSLRPSRSSISCSA